MQRITRPTKDETWFSPTTTVLTIVIVFAVVLFGTVVVPHRVAYLIYGNYKLYKENRLGSKKAKGRKDKEFWAPD